MTDLVLLGIDTGGTYTDAVIVTDEAVPQVLTSAKAPTTHHDLSVGIGEAISAALDTSPSEHPSISDRVGLVSISTTLATNAIVEGHGGHVCLITMGFTPDDLARGGLQEALGNGAALSIAGGHGGHGDELAPVDLAELDAALDKIDSKLLSGFAVVGQFAVRNADHEVAVREHLRQRFDLGVTCSHELSAKLNGPKRAVTSVLNARLVGLIGELVAATRTSMAERGIDAPLMVVRGDGSLISAELATERPIETILSGPAASVIGAQHLANLADPTGGGSIDRAIVSDIGGTTTDVAVIADGVVKIRSEGAAVGGHDTMVEAVDIHSSGLGGDSEVWIDDSGESTVLKLGPRRVVPVAVLAARYPDIVRPALDQQVRSFTTPSLVGCFAMLRRHVGSTDGHSEHEGIVLDHLADGPASLRDVLPTKRHEIALVSLIRAGSVVRSGFTPTDAAHVLGLHDGFDAEAGRHAAELLARSQDRRGAAIADDAVDLSVKTVDELRRRTVQAVLAVALRADGFESPTAAHPLMAAGFSNHRGHVEIDARLGSPLIGLGAAAPTYYPDVAHRLGTTAVLSEHAGVANAIGAIVGTIRIGRQATITKKKNGTFVADGEGFGDLTAAVAATVDRLNIEVADIADRAGASDIDLQTDRADNVVTIAGQDFFVDTTITVTGSGRPLRRKHTGAGS